MRRERYSSSTFTSELGKICRSCVEIVIPQLMRQRPGHFDRYASTPPLHKFYVETQGTATVFRLLNKTLVDVLTYSANYASRFSGIALSTLLLFYKFMYIDKLSALSGLYIVTNITNNPNQDSPHARSSTESKSSTNVLTSVSCKNSLHTFMTGVCGFFPSFVLFCGKRYNNKTFL